MRRYLSLLATLTLGCSLTATVEAQSIYYTPVAPLADETAQLLRKLNPHHPIQPLFSLLLLHTTYYLLRHTIQWLWDYWHAPPQHKAAPMPLLTTQSFPSHVLPSNALPSHWWPSQAWPTQAWPSPVQPKPPTLHPTAPHVGDKKWSQPLPMPRIPAPQCLIYALLCYLLALLGLTLLTACSALCPLALQQLIHCFAQPDIAICADVLGTGPPHAEDDPTAPCSLYPIPPRHKEKKQEEEREAEEDNGEAGHGATLLPTPPPEPTPQAAKSKRKRRKQSDACKAFRKRFWEAMWALEDRLKALAAKAAQDTHPLVARVVEQVVGRPVNDISPYVEWALRLWGKRKRSRKRKWYKEAKRLIRMALRLIRWLRRQLAKPAYAWVRTWSKCAAFTLLFLIPSKNAVILPYPCHLERSERPTL